MGRVFSFALKKFKSFGYRFFVGDITSRVGFRPFWLRLPDPGP